MKAVYHFDNYKDYINYRISILPKRGRGQFLQISKFLNVHTSLISQVLSGSKEFSLEQSIRIVDYFGLSIQEKDYFMILVNLSRAGTQELKNYYHSVLNDKKTDFSKVKSRIKKATVLNENQKFQYYSDWRFMAVWLATSLKKVTSVDDLEILLPINKKDIARILDFLISVGLCADDNDELTQGISKTHLDKSSMLINRHHINWRIKAIEKMRKIESDELFFTAPLTIAKEDLSRVKSILLDVIEASSTIVSKTNPEELACLNIDLFYI